MAPDFEISGNIVSRHILMSMLDGEINNGHTYIVIFLSPLTDDESSSFTNKDSILIIDSPEYVGSSIYSRVDFSFKNSVFRIKTDINADNDMAKYVLNRHLSDDTAHVNNTSR